MHGVRNSFLFRVKKTLFFWFIQHPGCYVGKQNERHQLFLIPVLMGFAKSRPAARGPVHGPRPSGPRPTPRPVAQRPTQRPLAQRPAAHSTDQRPNFFGQRLIEVHAQLWITVSITVGFSTWKMDDGEFPFSFRFLFNSILRNPFNSFISNLFHTNLNICLNRSQRDKKIINKLKRVVITLLLTRS